MPVSRTNLSLKKCSTPKGRQVRRLSRVEEKKDERREVGRKRGEARSCVDVFLKDKHCVLIVIRRRPQVKTVFLTFCESLGFLKL